MRKNHCLNFMFRQGKSFNKKQSKKIMLTHFESFFWYLQHLRVKTHFCKFSIATFQKWTF